MAALGRPCRRKPHARSFGINKPSLGTSPNTKTTPRRHIEAVLGRRSQPWPAALPEQVRAVAQVLAGHAGALPVAEIETRFKGRGPWKRSLPRILETLEALGRARREGAAWRTG